MADEELANIAKALAKDLAEAGEEGTESIAGFAETTAENAELSGKNLSDAGRRELGWFQTLKDLIENPERGPKELGPGKEPKALYSGAERTPTGEPNPEAVPRGRLTRVKGDAATKRSLQRENEAADFLAKHGYDVEQNPRVPGRKNPDYRISGRTVDCVAPETARVRNIWDRIRQKVVSGQTRRIVLVLDDTPVNRVDLVKYLRERFAQIPGLEEIIVIDHGNIKHIMHP